MTESLVRDTGGRTRGLRFEKECKLLGLAVAVLIPISHPLVAHAGPPPDGCVSNGDTGAALQQCEQARNAAPAPAPRGPGACGLDSCPSYGGQQTHGEGICAITGACTPPH
jgi:hypothetical protein